MMSKKVNKNRGDDRNAAKEEVNAQANHEFLGKDECYHRFKNIWCAKESALHSQGKYFHGNLITLGSHVSLASQAPSVDCDAGLFWTVVCDKEAVVLDLTNAKDGIEPYYPDSQTLERVFDSCLFIKYIISNSIEEWLAIHTYEMTRIASGHKQKIQRCSFTSWPDHGVIEMKILARLIKVHEEQFHETIFSIQCNAGVGRTGTVIAAMALKAGIQNGEISADNLEQKLENLILAMRAQRNDKMVETASQFELLLEYGFHLLNLG